MKRLVLTASGTVAGLAALLSFKTQTHPLADDTALPSAGTPTSSGATPSPATSAAGSATSSNKSSSGRGSSSSTSPSIGSIPKTYTGRAVTTRYGVVQVKVVVANGKITDVAFVQLTAFDGHSEEINSAAGPLLLRETISRQSAKVDTVSGASYTSEGYRESLQSALDKAGTK